MSQHLNVEQVRAYLADGYPVKYIAGKMNTAEHTLYTLIKRNALVLRPQNTDRAVNVTPSRSMRVPEIRKDTPAEVVEVLRTGGAWAALAAYAEAHGLTQQQAQARWHRARAG